MKSQGSRLQDTPSLSNVIAYAIERAVRDGLDECEQYHRVVHAVRRSEPHLTLLAAARMVNAHLEADERHRRLTRLTSLVTRGIPAAMNQAM